MNCCEKCFKDIELIAIIQGKQRKGNCDICKSKVVYIYDMDTDEGLDVLFDDFLSIYKPKSMLPDSFPNSKLCFLKDELVHNWNMFDLDSTQVYHLLSCLMEKQFPMKIKLLDEPVGIPQLADLDFIANNSILKSYSWEEFVEYIKHENRFHSAHINYDVLDEFLKGLIVTIKKGSKLYRGRISNDKDLKIIEMGAPPQEKATAGRANSEGISHLYLTTHIDTAIREIRPGEQDRVYIGEFILDEDLVIVDLRSLESISVFQGFDKLRYALNLSNIKKISNEISKPVRRNDSKLDYLPTQYIVDYIKSKRIEKEFEHCVGIGFKSTLCHRGHNIMIFNPEILDCNDLTSRVISQVIYN
ncbi:RES domain-containing protein [Lysinibacillus louembei]|uniref:RES domain-containing protein n=1 Tax=Lysinibacillus louembei TaxID=1470088 RepID=A0ABZ0RSY8_9BACI|nr:RES domain-containing protein [Lysinibacillus louembei]WPK10286.1 RES domain-containing protein [Lysinibacillus louembei]